MSSPPNTTDERRRSRRRPVDLFVQEIWADRTYLHPAINLSHDGIYILATDDDRRVIDGDARLELEFTLPGGHPVRTVGRVVRVDARRGQLGLGIAFGELDDATRAAIRAFVDADDADDARA